MMNQSNNTEELEKRPKRNKRITKFSPSPEKRPRKKSESKTRLPITTRKISKLNSKKVKAKRSSKKNIVKKNQNLKKKITSNELTSGLLKATFPSSENLQEIKNFRLPYGFRTSKTTKKTQNKPAKKCSTKSSKKTTSRSKLLLSADEIFKIFHQKLVEACKKLKYSEPFQLPASFKNILVSKNSLLDKQTISKQGVKSVVAEEKAEVKL